MGTASADPSGAEATALNSSLLENLLNLSPFCREVKIFRNKSAFRNSMPNPLKMSMKSFAAAQVGLPGKIKDPTPHHPPYWTLHQTTIFEKHKYVPGNIRDPLMLNKIGCLSEILGHLSVLDFCLPPCTLPHFGSPAPEPRVRCSL